MTEIEQKALSLAEAWEPDPSGDNYTRTSKNLRAAMKARGYAFKKIGEAGE